MKWCVSPLFILAFSLVTGFSASNLFSKTNRDAQADSLKEELKVLYEKLQNDPSDEDTRTELIRGLLESGDFEEAEIQYGYFEDEQKESGEIKTLYQRIRDQRLSRIENLSQSDDLLSDKAAFEEALMHYSKLGETMLAENLYRSALSEYPDNYSIRKGFINFLIEQRRLPEALTQVQYIRENDPGDKEANLLYAKISVWLDQDREFAREILNEQLENDPDNISIIILLAQNYLNQNDLLNAEEYIARAAEINPSHPDIQNFHIMSKNKPNSVENVKPERDTREIAKYLGILASNPNRAPVRYNLINELIKQKMFYEAAAQLDYLRENYEGTDEFDEPDLIVAQKISEMEENEEERLLSGNLSKLRTGDGLKLANLLNKKGEQEKGGAVLSLLRAAYPGNENILKESILNYAERGLPDSAYFAAKELLQLKRNSGNDELFWKAFSWAKQGGFDTGEIPVPLNNLSAGYLAAAVISNLDTENREIARARLDKLIELHPDSPDILNFGGKFYEKFASEEEIFTGKKEELINVFEEGRCKEAINIYESFPENHRRGKDFLSKAAEAYECEKQYLNAVEIYNIILAEEYDSGIHKRKAIALFKGGEYSSALEELKKLENTNPDDPETGLLRGDVYASIHRYDKARAEYNRIIEKFPEFYEAYDRLDALPLRKVKKGSMLGSVWDIDKYERRNIEVLPLMNVNINSDSYENIQAGLRVRTSWYKYIRPGFSYMRGSRKNKDEGHNYTRYFGELFVRPLESLLIEMRFGEYFVSDVKRNPDVEVKADYHFRQNYQISAGYHLSDAVHHYDDAGAIGPRIPVHKYFIRANGVLYKRFYLTINYRLMATDLSTMIENNLITKIPSNIGNDFAATVGFLIHKNTFAGYEYFYEDYKYTLDYYYSPQEFSTHYLWIDWYYTSTAYGRFDFNFGIKGGYHPENDQFLGGFSGHIRTNVYKRIDMEFTAGIFHSWRYNGPFKKRWASVKLYYSLN